MMPRFCCYVEKVFDFGERVETIHDRRQKPRIPASSIWMSAFWMFVTRRGSLNALESDLRVPKRWEGILGEDRPSGDRIGDVFCLIPPEALREILSGINHQLGRNKALSKEGALRFVAVDGHEFFSRPAPLLRGLFSADGDRQEPRGDRVLSPRSRLPSGGVGDGPAFGRRTDPAWRGRGHCGQKASGAGDPALWPFL